MPISYGEAIENVSDGLGDKIFTTILEDMEDMDVYLRYEKFCEILENHDGQKNKENQELRTFIHNLFTKNDLFSNKTEGQNISDYISDDSLPDEFDENDRED